MDIEWCIEADQLLGESIQGNNAIAKAVQRSEFTPSPEDLALTASGIRKLKTISADYKAIWEAVVRNKICVQRILSFGDVGLKEREEFLNSFMPGRKLNRKIFTLLCYYERGLRSQREAERAKLEASRKRAVSSRVIWWSEPESQPMPKVKSRIEVIREQQATLSERVALERHRDAFSNRGPQPRSDFRRFRN